MLKPFLKSALFWLIPAAIFGQQTPNMDNYQPARSSGTLPPDVLQTTTEKYERSKTQINTGQSEELQKAEDNFYLQTNYAVDQILHSGTILVNDSMGMYVNRVADSLLAHDPQLRAQINIYILRSTVVNAFATDRGSIFITVGLLTRLHNEAELAFVLAHEIIHFKRRHVLTGYIEGVQMAEGEGKYSATTAENRFLKRHSYARAQETQADEEGFDMLVASNYDPHAAMGAFDILEMAENPFTDTLFHKSIFEDQHFVFPSKYYADTVKAYKIDEDEEDNDLATHPSVQKRKKNMKRRFSKLTTDTTGSAFLVSESMFYRVRAMAMFEEAALHTNDGEFKEAIYINQSIQKIYPRNYYLQKEMVRAIYGATVKKNAPFAFDDFTALLEAIFSGEMEEDDKTDVPVGQQARTKSFISSSDRDGWNIAAIKYAWRVHTMFPEDKDIAFWCQGLFRELTVENNITIRDFQDNDSDMVRIGNMIMNDTALVHKLKVDSPIERWQIAIDHLDEDSLGATKYWEFAFVNELKDSAFVSMFKDAMAYADSLEALEDIEDDMTSKQLSTLEKEENESFFGPQGLTKVVVINPIYQSYDSRIPNGMLDVRKSIDGRTQMMNAMMESANAVGLQCEVLDPENMDSTDTDRFNDLMIFNDWFAQKGNFKEGDGLPVQQEQMNQLAAKYGTNYFMWCAYYTNREPRKGTVFRALSLAFAPIAPLVAYRLATPREDVYFVSIVYDITTGKPVWGVQREILKQKPTDARLKLQMYDMMRMLASPKKQKS